MRHLALDRLPVQGVNQDFLKTTLACSIGARIAGLFLQVVVVSAFDKNDVPVRFQIDLDSFRPETQEVIGC
jgi:hypothetical protein